VSYSESQCVEDPPRIDSLLREIHEQGAQLGIIPSGPSDKCHIGHIRGFSKTGLDLIVSDEAIRQFHIFSNPESKIVAHIQRGKVEFPLNASILPTKQSGSVVHIARPTTLYHSDRRNGQRARLPRSLSGVCQIRLAPGSIANFAIRDLSVSGIRLACPANCATPSVGSIWRRCHIRIEGVQPIAVDMIVVRTARNKESEASAISQIDIGCTFDRLPEPTQAQLQRTVIFLDVLERQQIHFLSDLSRGPEHLSRDHPLRKPLLG
jgi:hypothetical protein